MNVLIPSRKTGDVGVCNSAYMFYQVYSKGTVATERDKKRKYPASKVVRTRARKKQALERACYIVQGSILRPSNVFSNEIPTFSKAVVYSPENEFRRRNAVRFGQSRVWLGHNRQEC